MEIKQANEADAPAISALITSLTKAYVLPTCEPQGHQFLLDSMKPDCIRDYIAAGYCYLTAVDEADQIIGVIGIKDNTHLYHLFVQESYFGQGIARRLWEVAKVEMLARGNPGCFTVNSAVNAEPVYQSLGFERVAGIRIRGGIRDIPMKYML